MNSKKALDELKRILGEKDYRKVVDLLAGSTVYFPENHEWQNKQDRNIMYKRRFL